MIIRDMFDKKIDRPINGVIKVDQDDDAVIEDEVAEYVITKELKKHFINFFDYYSEAFSVPTADVGVWISGFFGSGKSHFLKMLSYILENKSVGGTSTVEMFRKKFEDDPATFMMIDRSTRGATETILFNIDIEGFSNKDKTAVLRVFAKMFYSHLGFFGENLKVAMLEQYIEQLGKTKEFRRVFEEKKGKPWLDQRKAFAFNRSAVIPTLMEVLGMSEEDAKQWFNDKSAVEISIAHLVEDIKTYVNSKPKDFRLLFMIDEVGQYVGTDTDLLLNLQSLVEKLGSECGGKVWVVCTGQEAIDEIIKVRSDEFSRIQARFKTRLSLSSSSVDEVVQKRILKKTPEAETALENLYDDNNAVLRNLYSFSNAVLDMKGYSGPQEFAVNYPFVPYQFIIMQKVFNEIRKHGNAGKHQSNGERSMLSGFQEAAQAVQMQDEYTLVPFFRFYDTLRSFLDSSIRRVIERCQKAADNGLGVESQDVDVLKLLYLIRYVDDIPSNLDNIVILMADDIRTDKIILREKVKESLNRLMSQNYIGRSGEIYNFLTDEEQEIQTAIRKTFVDNISVVEKIAQMIYGDIYTTKKYRFGSSKYNFDFDKMVDGITFGSSGNGMKLRFLTADAEAADKSQLRLMTESRGQAIVVLEDYPYFENLQNAMKIRTYVKQLRAQLPKSVQDIIRARQDDAGQFEKDATEQLKKAIEDGVFYVDGERVPVRGDAKSRIDQALEYLVSHVYSELELVTHNTDSDANILEILSGNLSMISGAEPNREAAAKVEEYLIIQDKMKRPTSMADVQARYQGIPYGWLEIDIAAVVALLIVQQKVTIKYGGTTIQPDNSNLPNMLRKKTEIGKTSISIRQHIGIGKIKQVKELLRDYFDVMDVPDDEDGLVAFIVKKFTEQKEHYETLEKRYTPTRKYPDKHLVQQAIALLSDILSQQKDNVALIDRLLRQEDTLLDSKEQLQEVESFFKNQVQIFDAAAQMVEDLGNELDYLSHEEEANNALNRIRLITTIAGNFSYKKIPELNVLMTTVHQGHDRLLLAKRNEIHELINQCLGAVYQTAAGNRDVRTVVEKAEEYFKQKDVSLSQMQSLALMDGMVPQMVQYKDTACARIEAMLKPAEPDPTPVHPDPVKPKKKIIKPYNRQVVFPAKTLESEVDIDAYVESIRKQLKQYLQGADGIQLK